MFTGGLVCRWAHRQGTKGQVAGEYVGMLKVDTYSRQMGQMGTKAGKQRDRWQVST
jgi:hypothetical protein